jgi:flagellar biosynthesis protein FliR
MITLEFQQYTLGLLAIICRIGWVFWLPLTGPFRQLPLLIRNSIVLVLAMALLQMQTHLPALSQDPVWLVLLKESVLGLFFSFLLAAPAAALLFVGKILDMQLGLSAATVLNPQTQQQESLLSTTLLLAYLTLFWQLGLQLDLLAILNYSLQLQPPGQSLIPDVNQLIRYFSLAFQLGLIIGMPLITVLFIVDVLLGILSKSMPALNVYFVFLPAKIMLGLMALALLLPMLQQRITELTRLPLQQLQGLL